MRVLANHPVAILRSSRSRSIRTRMVRRCTGIGRVSRGVKTIVHVLFYSHFAAREASLAGAVGVSRQLRTQIAWAGSKPKVPLSGVLQRDANIAPLSERSWVGRLLRFTSGCSFRLSGSSG